MTINYWKWDELGCVWRCPRCDYGFDDIGGVFDDPDCNPKDFGMYYCAHCGERVVDIYGKQE